MAQPSIAQQIEQMIQQRASAGPGMIDGYRSGLEAANTKDEKSINDMRSLYSDRSKFERSPMGALGLGLMKGTSSGNFSESMYNGLAAATATKDYNQEMNLSREEKLAKLSALEAQLGRQRAEDGMSVYDKQSSWMKSAQEDQSTLSDIQLGGQPGPRPLNPGEEGPEAPGSDMFSKSMMVYNDYLANPQKYAGPQGQAMVQSAVETIKNERTNARYERVAKMKNNGSTALPGPEQRRVSGRMKELDTAAEDARGLKASIASLKRARDGTSSEGGAAADTWATVGGWFGTEDSGHAQNVRAFATDMKLNLSQKLKGAISNAEQGMLDNATPGLSMTDAAATPVIQAYDLAADRVIERSKFMKAWTRVNRDDYGADEAWDQYVNDNPIFTVDDKGGWKVNEGNVGNWQTYVSDANAEDGAQAPDAGGDPTRVIGTDRDGNDITMEDILFTAEQNGITPEEVIQRLSGGKE